MSYRSFSLGWGWRMNSGHCVQSECPAQQTKWWGGVGRSLGRGSSGTGCWCSLDGDPLCDCCRWLPAARPESSGPSSHTRTGTDTSCTYKAAFHMNHTLSDIKQVQVSAKLRRSESNKSLRFKELPVWVAQFLGYYLSGFWGMELTQQCNIITVFNHDMNILHFSTLFNC